MNNYPHPHAILEPLSLPFDATAERIMRRNNHIKVFREHKRAELRDQHDPVKPGVFFDRNQEMTRSVYEEMFSVEYENAEYFSTELSFNILDWTILERIVTDKTYDLRNVDKKQRLYMCFNIYPRINSIFHELALNSHICDIKVLQGLFDLGNQQLPEFNFKKFTLPI